MVERAVRTRIDAENRAPTAREFEVFIRPDFDAPMEHIGSVRAADPEDAHETASRLFAWFADDVWVCPTESMTRFSTHDLAEETTTAEPPAGVEERTREWS